MQQFHYNRICPLLVYYAQTTFERVLNLERYIIHTLRVMGYLPRTRALCALEAAPSTKMRTHVVHRADCIQRAVGLLSTAVSLL